MHPRRRYSHPCKRIESGQLVMGVPGKVVHPITEAERERIYDGVKHYAERAQEYRRMLAEMDRER